MSAAFTLPFGPSAVFHREVARRLMLPRVDLPVLTESDIAPLPAPVQAYLRYTGAVSRPRVENFRATFRGTMRFAPDAPWMPIAAEQYSFFNPKSRLFLIHAARYGVPFDALHVYRGSEATMRVKVASLVPIVDARGPEMNQSETVTMFNDMCLLAPATLIDPAIRWTSIDSRHVKAAFTNAGHTIDADLFFDASGALTNFTSDDRYQSADGRSYRKLRWETPVTSYRDMDGRRVPGPGDAIWTMPEGPFVYARFETTELQYNVGAAQEHAARTRSRT